MTETDFGGGGPERAGARCALHSDQPAARTCTRCGSFMCSMCAEGGAQTLCPACQQRMGVGQGFPLNRENWTVSALWDYCFEIFKREWLMLSVGMVAFFGIIFVVQLIGSLVQGIGGMVENKGLTIVLAIASVFVQQVVQGVLGLGLMQMMFGLLRGEKADIGRLFSQFHKVVTYLVTMLIVFLVVGLPTGVLGAIIFGLGTSMGWESAWPIAALVGALALIPLIYFGIPLSLLQAEIAYNDDASPIQMIKNCYAYARGERLSIVGVALVTVVVAIVGLLACCVGIIPAVGLIQLLLAGLYLSLRNGADTEG